MITRFLGLERYVGMMAIGFALTFVAGCAKKVPPVSGASGLSTDDGASEGGGSSNAPKPGGNGMVGSDEVTSRNQEGSQEGLNDVLSGDDGGMGSMQGSQGGMGSGMTGDSVSFAENVYFDYDKAVVRSDAKSVLEENARWLASNPHVNIQIEGHGDERGTNEYNLALGERRARTILRYLANLGINESRFSFISYGEEKSVCSDPNEACYQKNRRAYFQVKE